MFKYVWWCFLNTLVCVLRVVAYSISVDEVGPQVAFQHQLDAAESKPRHWQDRIAHNATGNLIFNSVGTLLQMAPNSRYTMGHSIVRTTIAPGTLLYHGRQTREPPQQDWIAFDPEHSILFTAFGNGTLFTYVATRELSLVYFDGASGNKVDGVADPQDILFLGITREPFVDYDPQRLAQGCSWGKEYGIDGFIRMEFDFEIMYCDFSQGLEVVSMEDTLLRYFLPNQSEPPPQGWKGSALYDIVRTAVSHAATWHNNYPGEGRVQPDLSTLVTFFDPAFTSLISQRRGKSRKDYLITNISEADIALVRADFIDALNRPRSERSGVDWAALSRVIVDRFSDRLPFLRYLIHNTTAYANATAHAAAVRKHIGVSLLPYMSREGIEDFDGWLEHMANGCADTFTSHLPQEKMTKQESVIHDAFEEVLREICRVYTTMWKDAFDVEEQPASEAEKRLSRWREEVDGLIDWLDWPAWYACEPACAVNEICYVTQHWFWELRAPPGADRSKPYCVDLATAEIAFMRPLPQRLHERSLGAQFQDWSWP